MRRQHFEWTFLVLALVMCAYGGYTLIYNSIHNKEMNVLSLVFFIVGIILFVTYFVLFILNVVKRKKASKTEVKIKKTEEIQEKEEEPLKEETKAEESNKEPQTEEKEEEPEVEYQPRNDVTYVRSKVSYRSSGGSGYVKKVGYGPVLRINGNQILDMRDNTYYEIDGNHIKRSGYGPVFEINGSSIRLAFGSYLYEISGSNVNKTFGGYYASFSGGYLQTHDLSEKYEVCDDLTLRQKLAIVALLFGSY